jgi:hypothetical protein
LPRRWSGLMRGAVSVALVYFYFDTATMDEQRATIISRWAGRAGACCGRRRARCVNCCVARLAASEHLLRSRLRSVGVSALCS